MSARVTDDPHNTPTGPDQGDDVAGTSIDGADLTIVLNRYDIGSIQHVSEFQKGSRRAPKMMIRTQGGEYLLKRLAPGRPGFGPWPAMPAAIPVIPSRAARNTAPSTSTPPPPSPG